MLKTFKATRFHRIISQANKSTIVHEESKLRKLEGKLSVTATKYDLFH